MTAGSQVRGSLPISTVRGRDRRVQPADVLGADPARPAGGLAILEVQRRFYYDLAVNASPRNVAATRFHWNDFFTPVTGHLTTNMKAIDDVAAGWDYLIGQLNRTHAEFAPLEGYSSVILFGPTGRAV